MNKNFTLLVFDWDGTLMDSASVIVLSIQAACRDLHLPVPSDAAASHVIGLGLPEAIAALLPDLAPSEYARFTESYRHHFLGENREIPLFDGVADAIKSLREVGYLLAVATGKGRRGLDHALQYSGLGGFFHASRCADECFSKPHPQMLLELMEELGVPAKQTLMIGDTSHDLQMANNAGVAALAAGYGAHPVENLAVHSPLACFDNFSDLHCWLVGNA
ncbi:MAG: HAD-IIIA family hydrolase [Burkholderiales bacterium]